jgi:hypothetical protein
MVLSDTRNRPAASAGVSHLVAIPVALSILSIPVKDQLPWPHPACPRAQDCAALRRRRHGRGFKAAAVRADTAGGAVQPGRAAR